jgi:hypothetical protein
VSKNFCGYRTAGYFQNLFCSLLYEFIEFLLFIERNKGKQEKKKNGETTVLGWTCKAAATPRLLGLSYAMKS